MKLGVFADIHDNVDNLRHAINVFNAHQCAAIIYAGDFVSPLVVPAMRKLTAPVIACYGDNDGNRRGIAGGMKIVGTLGHPPFSFRVADGTRVLICHQLNEARDCLGESDIVVFAHTHRPSVATDRNGRLFVNPGETGGWMFRKPSVALVETDGRTAEIVPLPEMPPPVHVVEPG